MAERALQIVIEVDDRQAQQALQRTDRGLAQIEKTTQSTGGALSQYEKTVEDVVRSKQALATVSGSVFDRLEETKQATKAAAEAQRELFTMVNRGSESWGGYAQAAKDMWSVVRGLSFSDVRAGINGIAEAAGLSAGSLGLLGSAGAVAATAMASWEIGKYVGQWTGLTEAIQHATEKVMGWGTSTQALAAHQDALNLAIARGGKNLTNYTEVLAYNTQWVKNQQEGLKELADISVRQNAFENNAKAIAKWRAAIDDMQRQGVLEHLKQDIQSGAFTTQQLTDSYRVSSDVLRIVQLDLKAQADQQKAAAEATRKHNDELRRQQEEIDKTTAKVHELETGYYGLSSSVTHLGTTYEPVSKDVIKQSTEMLKALHKIEGGAEGIGRSIQLMGEKAIEAAPKFSILQQVILKIGETFSPSGIFRNVVESGISAIFGPTGLVQGLIQKGLTVLGNLVWNGVKKIGGFFKNLFGGPDSDEIAGRQLVANFEENLHTMLTDGQRTGESWKDTIIAVRDKYIELGRTEAEALADVQRLWESSKHGPEAVASAIQTIQDKMNGLTVAAGNAAAAIGDLGGGGDYSSPGQAMEAFHSGGMVTGRLLPFLPRAHRGLAVDEVPIIAQRGEGILNRTAMRRIGGASTLNRLNAGGSMGSGIVWTGNVVVDGDLNSAKARRKVQRSVNGALSSLMRERRQGSAR